MYPGIGGSVKGRLSSERKLKSFQGENSGENKFCRENKLSNFKINILASQTSK